MAQKVQQRPKPGTRKQVHPLGNTDRAFGEALREVRTRRGISQEALGLEAGFDRTFISLLERGLRSPTIRTLVKLAEVLEVRPSEIVREMEGRMVSQ